MKSKMKTSQLIQNFDDEIDSKIGWLDIHINMMFNEVHEIKDTIYIFKTVEAEWNRRFENGEKICYSAIRTILYESLPYKIILGLSKILVGNREYSLLKTINVISQMEEYKNNKEVKKVISEIENYIETSEMVKIITTYRDRFFAHLDKDCVLSDCRIDPTVPIDRIKESELDECMRLIGELYNVCFNQNLEYHNKELSQKDIIYTFFGCKIQKMVT